jgi:hypothetical protein
MARARNIKPGLYKNEDLAECSIWARFVFPGLWMLADRDGRMEDRPKRIKAELLPFDNADLDQLLNELERFGFILRYEVEGERYIQVLKFNEHQAPHVREQAGTIPAPPTNVQGTTKAVPSNDLSNALPSPRSPSSLIPDSLIPDSLIVDKPTVEAPAPILRKTDRPDGALEVFSYWQQTLGHPTAKLDAKRIKAIKGRLADGYTVGQLCQAVDGCKYDPFSQGQNDRQAVFDDIELICRDGPKVDKFRKIAERGPPNGRSVNQNKTISNLQAYLDAHEN